jgi:hypothetical protein
MLERRCVLLRHEQPHNPHYDLMIEDPAAAPGEGALVSWRIGRPSWEWSAAGKLELVRVGDHRRAYLSRGGAVSRGRGWVWRVDEGTAVVQLWASGRAVVELRLGRFRGAVHLDRLDGDRWTARFAAGADAGGGEDE